MVENERYTERELWVQRGDMRIYGVLFVPEGASGDAPQPAVICSHILGGTHENSGRYAREMAARGYVAYAFDFCGGAIESRSTGKTTESSIKTEAADLNAVFDVIRALPEVDARNVFLFGQSQGGAVSAMVAAERPDDVAGLVLLYPAFIIHGLAVDMFGTPENAPEVYHLWHDLGHIYAVDAIEYEAPAKYAKVLPADKVAKLVLSEERFRQQQIGRLGGGNRPGGPGEHRPHQGGSGKGQRN